MRAASAGTQLVRGRKAMILAKHNDRGVDTRGAVGLPIETLCGGLQQRLVTDQTNQLLREMLARHGPQACARATGQDDGLDSEFRFRGGWGERSTGKCRVESGHDEGDSLSLNGYCNF